MAGGAYVARSGDNISSILGASSPQAVGNFMRANNLTSSQIEAGRNYFVPSDIDAYGDAAALGQSVLSADNRRLDLAAAAKIQGLTRYSAADRLADSNYRLALESQERLARSQSFSPTGPAASRLMDPDVQQAQAMGMDVDFGPEAPMAIEPGRYFNSSNAAKVWNSDHEIKFGGALYVGLGGSAEGTLTLNPAKGSLTFSEFEWGLGLGVGLKAKAGWEWLKEGAPGGNMPLWALWKDGGQASGTGAVSLKFTAEVAGPGFNIGVAEGRLGVQSPLNGAPAGTPMGAFYEGKLFELKAAPTFQGGATLKLDIFNNSYKRASEPPKP
ncbi:hypothetical protein DBR42_13930 [Pelomonas sp. HMWF004]|nr:hypothetical protein DBR42_13930 [Pelomonas sp. HMWF004]